MFKLGMWIENWRKKRADKIYVRIGVNTLFVKSLKTGKTFFEPSVVVLGGEGKRRQILGAGKSAAAVPLENGVERLTPFDGNPQRLLSDPDVAEALLAYAVRHVVVSSFVMPDMYIEISRPLDGGLSAEERGTLEKICHGVGARKAHFLPPETMKNLSWHEVEDRLMKM